MKDIIEKLYHLYTEQQSRLKQPVKQEDLKNDKQWIAYNNFYNRLSEKQKRVYLEYEEMLFAQNYEDCVEAFGEGFKEGCSLILKILKT